MIIIILTNEAYLLQQSGRNVTKLGKSHSANAAILLYIRVHTWLAVM